MMLGIANKDSDAINRSLTFWTEFEKPNPFNYVISPGNITLEHGSSFTPKAEFSGNVPGELLLAIKSDIETEYRYRPMRSTDVGLFESQPVELTNNSAYYVKMDDFRSEVFTVDVQLLPRFEELSVTIQPPAYTRLPAEIVSYPFARVRAIRGSEITMTGLTNKEVNELTILKGGEGNTAEISGGNQFEYSFTAVSDDTLSFQLTDNDQLTNRNPFQFDLQVLPDESPVVIIREPEGDKSIANPQRLDIFYQASDDFGLTRARLEWELLRAFTEEPVTGTQNLAVPRSGVTEFYEWLTDDLNMNPRDVLTFRIRVWDNDGYSGAKQGVSQNIKITVPSMSAFFDELDSQERDVESTFDEVTDNYNEIEEEFENLMDQLRENPEPGWQEQQALDEIIEKQEQMDEVVRKLNEQFEEVRREMEESNMISNETRQAYRELQQLMEELDDPDIRRAMEELRRAMEEMNPQDLQRALENMEFNEEVYRERLERTLELFKSMKLNSDLDRLASRFEDMADQLNEVSSDEDANLDRNRAEIEALQQDAESLGNQLENLDRNPPKRTEEEVRNLKEQTEQALEQIQQKLEEMKQQADREQGEGGEKPSESLREQQQQVSREMQQQSQELRSAMMDMMRQQMQVNLLALQRSLYSLIGLSEVQEELTVESGRTPPQNQGFVDLARQQQNVRAQFSQVADSIFSISAQLPGVPNTINRKKVEVERVLENSRNLMAERDQRGSSIASRESLGGINELASMIANLIDQLLDQQGGGGGGSMSMQQMMEEMQNMGRDQQILNQQIQEMLNDIQGERLTQEQSDRLDQLALQQNEIRRRLQELQRSGALEQGDRALSEMERMIREMEDAINDLRGGMTDPIMIERQQNILSRMLEAEQAMQERGEDEEREGQRPVDFDRAIPPDITLDELRREIRSRLQDPNYTRFRDDYQRLIERYFEMLRRVEEREIQ
jgi:ABC-type transporter Mla subunit MlaD